jgi:site-specific DNA-methyltransferase (adenine-specific)
MVDWSVLVGDCREVMAGMEADSVDSIVTDPPYGLSSGSANSREDGFLRAFFDVHLPNLADAYSHGRSMGNLPLPRAGTSLLAWMDRAIWENARVRMPESAVHFEGNVVCWQPEIKRSDEPSVVPPERVLPDELNLEVGQDLGNYVFYLRHLAHPTFGNGKGGFFTQEGLGVFTVPIVVPDAPCFRSLLCALGQDFLWDRLTIVGDSHDPLGLPLGASDVVAPAGTVLCIMARFDMRLGTLKFLPASPACQPDFACELIPTELVGTGFGTSGLSSKFEATKFSLVGGKANGTLTVNFHKALIQEATKKIGGFMGKEWDHGVPGVEFWEAALRVAKPGAYLLAFGGTRTFHRLACAIEDAGWEVRDTLGWLYGSGFPKNHNALKPAWEPIILARKPPFGSVAGNIQRLGTGGLNVEDCRVPIDAGDAAAIEKQVVGFNQTRSIGGSGKYQGGAVIDRGAYSAASGRWPANIVHDGSDEVLGVFPETGKSTGGQASLGAFRNGAVYGKGRDERESRDPGFGDSGSAARFFYCAKASKADRDEGCEGLDERVAGIGDERPSGQSMQRLDGRSERISRNHHPTVKPTALMRWLVRLVTPRGGLVLDPFTGSGSTGKAAVLEGFNFIGAELNPEYAAIAEARIAKACVQPDFL